MSENAILSGPEVSAGFAEVMYCLIGLFCKRPIRTGGSASPRPGALLPPSRLSLPLLVS